MSITDVLGMVGGLALFLYGMNSMGASLEKRAGNRLKSILTRLTASPMSGFLLGMVVTAIIQSSSATTVMVVGFVNSGLMTLTQSVYIIMGANVGSAVTSWILSMAGISGDAWYLILLKPSTFTPVIALVGVGMLLFSKKQTRKDTAGILLGFSVLMFGMEMMSSAVAPLADMPGFTQVLVMFRNPILGVLAGTVITAAIQSSAASVGILQALSMTGKITYGAVIPIVMGQNIGTCITALLSSIGTTREARRASMIHLYFNVIGMIVWLTVYYAAEAIFRFPFVEAAASPLGVAVVHTAFKVLSTLLLMPFGKQLEKLARLSVPDGKEKKKEEIPLLDERFFVTPSVALERAHVVLIDMAQLSTDILTQSLDLFDHWDEKKAVYVRAGEEKADLYEDKLGTYLVKLSAMNMSEKNSHDLTKYLHMISDLERISDHAVNIMMIAQEMSEKGMKFSDDAAREVKTITDAVREILRITQSALEEDDLQTASFVEPLEQVIDRLEREIKARHVERLTHGECTVEMGFVLTDLLADLKRVSDHCSNLAVCIIEIAHNSLEAHEYLHEVKSGETGEFAARFENYCKIFSLEPVEE